MTNKFWHKTVNWYVYHVVKGRAKIASSQLASQAIYNDRTWNNVSSLARLRRTAKVLLLSIKMPDAFVALPFTTCKQDTFARTSTIGYLIHNFTT